MIMLIGSLNISNLSAHPMTGYNHWQHSK